MTVSPAMQRYAAEIYRLQQGHERVSLSLLSSNVESSAQAISTMVKRLGKADLAGSEEIHPPICRGV